MHIRLTGALLIIVAALAFARPWVDAIPFTTFMLVEGGLLLAAAALGWAGRAPFGRIAATILGAAGLLALATYGNLAWWRVPMLWDIFPLVAVALIACTGAALVVRSTPAKR